MKKRIIMFLIMCLCFSMQGCKSVDSLLKEGKYEEAYSFSKTEEEKLKVINQMFSDNKYDEAMELLAEDYDELDEEKKKVRLDLFMDKITVKSKVRRLYKKIVFDAYEAFNENKQYTKAWVTMCMFGASDIKSIAYIDKLVQEGVYVELITECAYKSSNEYREKYNWIQENLIPYLRSFVNQEFQSNTRESEKQLRRNALSSIQYIAVKYNESNYIDDYGDRKNVFKESDPVMCICVGNKAVIWDYYGKTYELYDYSANTRPENGSRFNLKNVSLYSVNRHIINLTDMSPLLYRNKVTNAYFEVISGDQMVDKAKEYLINQIK